MEELQWKENHNFTASKISSWMNGSSTCKCFSILKLVLLSLSLSPLLVTVMSADVELVPTELAAVQV